jgi:hypothetical protein
MNVNIYVNMGEENAAKKRGLWSSWSFWPPAENRARYGEPYTLIVYIYIFFLKYKINDQNDQKPHKPATSAR